PGEYEAKKVALQVWLVRVEKDGKTSQKDKEGHVLMDRIIFGRKMAELRQQITESSLRGRNLLNDVLKTLSLPGRDKKTPPLEAAVVSKNQFKHHDQVLQYINGNEIVIKDASLKEAAKETGFIDAATANKSGKVTV